MESPLVELGAKEYAANRVNSECASVIPPILSASWALPVFGASVRRHRRT
jgi:hypothetical protein